MVYAFFDQNERRNFCRGPYQHGSDWHSNFRREDFFCTLGNHKQEFPMAAMIFF
jgi:hypothetical protein